MFGHHPAAGVCLMCPYRKTGHLPRYSGGIRKRKIHHGPRALRPAQTGQRRSRSGWYSVYASRAGRQNLQNKLSVVFQDYTTSANPRFRVKDIIGEGLTVQERERQKIRLPAAETSRLLELVGCLPISQTGFPMSFPADSCSASASPGLWPASRRSSSLTKPSPPWMPTPRSRSWTFCGN